MLTTRTKAGARSAGVRSAASRNKRKTCQYYPCAATKRGTTFENEQRLLTHHQTHHSKELRQYAEQIAQEALRRKVDGGIRAITDSAMKEYGMNDKEKLRGGQEEMDRRTQNNYNQFEDPITYQSLRVTRSDETAGGFLVPTNDDSVSMPDHGADEVNNEQKFGINEYEVHSRREHPTGGRTIDRLLDSEMLFPTKCNPFAPFNNPYDFKMGSWLIRGNATNTTISSGFNDGILQRSNGNDKTSITSAHTLHQRVDGLEPAFGERSWNYAEAVFWAEDGQMRQPYYYRDPTLIIKHLFKQPAYRDYLAYKPVREYNEKGDRIYSEINTADWMWEQQVKIELSRKEVLLTSKQDKIPLGGTVVPTFFTSDQTKLSTHVGGHYFWPLYMSIGNLHSTIRSRPSNNAWILLAQLPVPPTMRKHHETIRTGGKSLDKDGYSKADFERLYKTYKEDALGVVIQDILKPLKESNKEGIRLECADGFARTGFPVVAAWLADFQEYNKLYTTSAKGCCLCEVAEDQLGDNFIATRRDSEEHTKCLQLLEFFKDREKKLYRARQDSQYWEDAKKNTRVAFPKNKKEIEAELRTLKKQIKMAHIYFNSRQAKPIDNALWKTGVAHIQDVWKPDLLHTIYEGMVPHVLTALEQFLKEHRRLNRFEEAWMRIPAFGSIPAPKKSIFETEQRTGKALRDTLRQLLPVLVIALEEPTAAQHFEFYDCLATCRYLVDFSLICQYRFHTQTSLNYLWQYLDGFHKHKNVFNKYRPVPTAFNQQTMVRADTDNFENPFSCEYPEEFSTENNRNREHIAKEQKQKTLSTLQIRARDLFDNNKEQLQHWLDESDTSAEVFDFNDVIAKIEEIATKRELRYLDHGAYWKLPKLHLLSHFGETISRFGYLQQYSSEVGETLHKGIKEAFRFSNKNNQIPQILQFHTRKFAVRMREMNLEQLARNAQYQEEIQEALSLYGRREDKLLAAKLNRDGVGSIKNTKYYAEQAENAKAAAEHLLATFENPASQEATQVPTDAPWYLPAPLPLFPEIIKRATGRRFYGRIAGPVNTLTQLSISFQLPKLAHALHHYLLSELDYPDIISPADLTELRTIAWSNLHITSETVQAVEPLEVHKCVCSGPYRAPRLKVPRNDAVVFEDQDEYTVLTKRDGMFSDFGPHRFGILKCLFQICIPKLELLEEFLTAGILNCDESYFETVSLALIDGFQPQRYDDEGEMVPAALIGKCKIPQKLKELHQGHKENFMATHNVQKRNNGRVLSIDSIIRAAHLIPQHNPLTEENDDKKIWVVNNRSDMGIWDMLYAKATERDENLFAASALEDIEMMDNP